MTALHYCAAVFILLFLLLSSQPEEEAPRRPPAMMMVALLQARGGRICSSSLFGLLGAQRFPCRHKLWRLHVIAIAVGAETRPPACRQSR